MDTGMGLLAFQPPRRNGFEKPLETSQVVSWVLFTFFGLSFLFLSAPAFGLAVGLGLLLPYFMLCVFVFITGWLATAIDTTDPHLLERSVKKEEMTDEIAVKMRRTMPPNVEWCFNCKWYVSKNSYHCRRCNKCSRGLDHHCAFLNNCIAEKNYSMFMACTLSAVILLAYQLVIDLVLLTVSFVEYDSLVENLAYFYGTTIPETVFKVIMIVVSLLLVGSLIMIGHLLVFHIFLYFRGQLTHEFLMGEQSFSESHSNPSQHHKSNKSKKTLYCGCLVGYNKPKAESRDRSDSERRPVHDSFTETEGAVTQGSSVRDADEMPGIVYPA